MRKCVPLLLLLAGLSLVLYPSVSRLLSRSGQNQLLDGYRAAVKQLRVEERARRLEAAWEEPSLLELGSEGIIGYVTIPKLQTELPIYPGTGEDQLAKGAGLLEGTSLPIGGEGRHSVLSAHCGLPEARLFTDLDQLEAGDVFFVTVLDRTLAYRVICCTVTLPQDTQALQCRPEDDLCTLLTCTPLGINSHRLLVQGRRTALLPQIQPNHSFS